MKTKTKLALGTHIYAYRHGRLEGRYEIDRMVGASRACMRQHEFHPLVYGDKLRETGISGYKAVFALDFYLYSEERETEYIKLEASKKLKANLSKLYQLGTPEQKYVELLNEEIALLLEKYQLSA